MKMRNDNSSERMTIALLIVILMIVIHSNWTMRKEMADNANQQASESTESIMNDEEITSRDVDGEVILGAHSSAGIGKGGSEHKCSADNTSGSNTVTGEVKGEADLGEPANGADLEAEESEEGLSEPEGAGLSNDNAQITSEAVGEKVDEVLGQLGDGFRNVIGTLDDKLNVE